MGTKIYQSSEPQSPPGSQICGLQNAFIELVAVSLLGLNALEQQYNNARIYPNWEEINKVNGMGFHEGKRSF